MKLACLGDLHLDERSPRYGHALVVLDAALHDAWHEGARGFILLGDTCEGRPTPQVIAALAQRFHRIRDGGGWVAVVQGNHEDYETGLVWEALGVRRSAWNTMPALHDEATILLVPYPRRGRAPFDELAEGGSIRDSMAAAAERIAARIAEEQAATAEVDGRVGGPPAPLLVFGHVTIEGLRVGDSDFELHQAQEVIVPQAALAPAALTVVGHIHRAQEVTPTIIGAGSLYRCSFAEAGDDKSYVLVTVDEGRVTWERRPVPARGMQVVRVAWSPGLRASLAAADPLFAGLSYAGQEVKLVVEIPEDQLATFDASIFDPVREATALFVLEKDVAAIQRTRAPALAAADTPDAQLAAWLAATEQPIGSEDVERLSAKLAEVTR